MKTLAIVVLLVSGPALGRAEAQDALGEAKAQYEAAAYEEALATLTRISEAPSIDRVEVEQYRALCLIALGNLADAERAVAALVAANPVYVPSESVASPRVLALVADIRKRELPAAARRLLDAGRTAYQSNDLALAKRHFDLLLEILDDPAMAGRSDRADLLPLAQGFVALIAATGTPPGGAPTPAHAGTNGAGAAATNDRTETPAAAAEGFYVPPVAIEQALPEWEPPSVAVAKLEYIGRLRVEIGLDGKVTGATIEEPSHAFYDRKLLEVARTWLYKPALRNGVPVASEKTIAIRLIPEP
jgi:TonB family protein